MAVPEPVRRLQLIERLLRLPSEHLDAVERFVTSLPLPSNPRPAPPAAGGTDWPHAPTHRTGHPGTFIVTAATLHKDHFFRGAERLDYLQGELLSHLANSGWKAEAWAVFSNHYHFVAHSLPDAAPLPEVLKELHRVTSLFANERDERPGRQCWFQYWDTCLTYESSHLARLSYVHQNPVKHGLVPVANQYRWCSAARFEQTAPAAQVTAVYRLKTDRVRVHDDFDPVGP